MWLDSQKKAATPSTVPLQTNSADADSSYAFLQKGLWDVQIDGLGNPDSQALRRVLVFWRYRSHRP
jgi:hypothetical protein